MRIQWSRNAKTVLIVLIFTIGFTHLVASGAVIEVEGETRWQLHNQCSQGLLQTYMGYVNALGKDERLCLTEFRVSVNRDGAFQLQHAQSHRFLCFNRRSRITLRLFGNTTRCYFHERISDNGYSLIESAWKPSLYLGFNSRGRFQDPATFASRRRCFDWMKFERYVSTRERTPCSRRAVVSGESDQSVESSNTASAGASALQASTNHPFSERHLRAVMRERVLNSLRPDAVAGEENIHFSGSSKFQVKLTAYQSL